MRGWRAMSRCAVVKPRVPTSEQSRDNASAKDGSERLFNAMAVQIERLARRKRVPFDHAAVMAQNGVWL